MNDPFWNALNWVGIGFNSGVLMHGGRSAWTIMSLCAFGLVRLTDVVTRLERKKAT